MYRNIYGALPLPSAEAIRNEFAKGARVRAEKYCLADCHGEPSRGLRRAPEKNCSGLMLFFPVHRDYYRVTGKECNLEHLSMFLVK